MLIFDSPLHHSDLVFSDRVLPMSTVVDFPSQSMCLCLETNQNLSLYWTIGVSVVGAICEICSLIIRYPSH